MTLPVVKPDQNVTTAPERSGWIGALLINRVAAHWRQQRVPDVIALPDRSGEKFIDQDHH